LAANSAFLINGRIVINEKDPAAARGYELFGVVAQSAELAWGDSWRTLKDQGHVELRRPGVLRPRPAAALPQNHPPSPGVS
jgi:peptidoglycan L-alanyl-D-glutamate endopeptidase CwlK